LTRCTVETIPGRGTSPRLATEVGPKARRNRSA